ncbi:MAG: CRISPR-associated endonuclease Cas2, partial [Nitrososphaerota archaeon]|nr:CRISPR-associated endonuclease Cas2 [Nitrososphaerota archaeon]
MKPELLDFVVSYDITDNRKRKKIADILDEYGRRVQYSVYEITVPSREVGSLRSRLAKHLR